MKKLATLILAAGLVFGAATGASAIDFKAKGWWVMDFEYGQNGNFEGKYNNGINSRTPTGWNGSEDDFEAKQRVRLQLDAVASESLSGTVFFEIGTQYWGKNASGAALGADSTSVIKLRRAYLDWIIPETEVKVRMGIQGVALPSYTIGSSTVFDDDVAGIVASAPINEMVGITAMWLRPFNDNFTGDPGTYRSAYMDNMDAFALLVPLTFEGARVTPWGMYAAIGPNTFRSDNDYLGIARSGLKTASSYAYKGLFPVAGSLHKNGTLVEPQKKLNSYGNAWWAGITGELTMWDPLRVAFDFNYGSVEWEDDGRLMRQGWLASLLFEYKMDWGIPGIYGWYGSGDDDNPSNGSERMPTLSANNSNQFSHFAFNGDPNIARDGVITDGNMGGTWGIGVRLKDMTFIENVKHTFRINYIGGTNSPSMAKKLSMNGMWVNQNGLGAGTPTGHEYQLGGGSLIGRDNMYLTTMDSALEFGLTNTWKPYDNFTIGLEADYIALWLDTSSSVWGAPHRVGGHIPDTKDAWNLAASFVYSF